MVVSLEVVYLGVFTGIAGMSRAGQLAIAGRLTAGSSRIGAMVSSVM
jgi:hypothetical protein